MADAIVSRIGQINAAGDPLALFLKVYAGRVLNTFLRSTAFKEHHLTQSIASGKSAQFPATGILQAINFNPGDEVIGQVLNNAEKVIYIEGKKLASVFIADIDYLMNHFDYSQYVAEQLGQSLSKAYDQDVSRVMANAARITVPNVLGVFPGDTLASTEINPLFATDGPTIANGIYDGAVALDTRDVPPEDRAAFFRPTQYALVVKDGRAVDTRFNEDSTDLGGFSRNYVKMVANIPIIKSNNYANTNDIGNTFQPAGRQHDYSTSQGLITHKTAAGTVALTEMSTESWYDPRRQGNFMLGKYICGHDSLRPESAFELQSAAPAG